MSRVGRLWVVGIVMLAGWVQAQGLDALRQTYAKQEKALLDGYSNALVSAMADLKKRGNLDAYVVVEAEQNRFGATNTVPTPQDAKDAFRGASTAYHEASVALLRRYIEALDGFVRKSLQADKVDEAKAAKTERDSAASALENIEDRIPKAPKSLTGKWIHIYKPNGEVDYRDEGYRLSIVQTGSKVRVGCCKIDRPSTELWVGDGSFSNGEVKLTVVPTRAAPKDWISSQMVLTLTNDTLIGSCLVNGKVQHSLKWPRQ